MNYPKEEQFYNDINSKYNISRGGNMEDLRILLENVESIISNGNYVEIGVADGSSIITVASFRPDINCYGIEIKPEIKGEKAIKDLGLNNIHFYLGKGAEEICKEWNKEIDLLFIDGEHTFPNIFWDFVGWYPYVKSGSKILFHDFEKWQEGKYQIGLAARVFQGHQKYNFYSAALNDNISSSMISIIKP